MLFQVLEDVPQSLRKRRMPSVSRIAELVRDYRAARAGVALLGGVGGALSPLSALAQDKTPGAVQTAQVQVGAPIAKANFVKPPMALEPHCPIIKRVFDMVEFQGDFKGTAASCERTRNHAIEDQL